MDPADRCHAPRQRRLPRTRGDGPRPRTCPATAARASPHTRGWTRILHARLERVGGFPAHAGMDPRQARLRRRRPGLPRTRGDGPARVIGLRAADLASPHTRGWTLEILGNQATALGFPAHAGMDPAAGRPARPAAGLPRTRGDGPNDKPAHRCAGAASPHTRGWTRPRIDCAPGGGGFPAHAGMDLLVGFDPDELIGLPRTRGDGPCGRRPGVITARASPHTRGWTLRADSARIRAEGFPAHAGMDPARSAASRRRAGLPRTRGDGPGADWTRFGRIRASPHTRGWTLDKPVLLTSAEGFPAHAGMDPAAGRPARTAAGLPRTRGDGPLAGVPADRVLRASPHTRGWTRVVRRPGRGRTGFPAHAGMDPQHGEITLNCKWLPRTRGDGPYSLRPPATPLAASPHTRGWTRCRRSPLDCTAGFPAHAGMDPCARPADDVRTGLPRTRGDGP